MPSRALLLINPGARSGSTGADDVVTMLRERGIATTVAPIENPAELTALIRSRATDDVDCIVVGGGDGTLGASAAGVIESGLPLGILPLGTANNLARTLEIPDDLGLACDIIAAGRERRIDVGRVNDRHFFTTASLGLSVQITKALDPGAKRRFGVLAYVVAAARVVARARPFQARITWEGGEIVSHTVQIVVGNGRYYGSALQVADDATIDDQALDLYSIEIDHWWELLALGFALKRGDHGRKRTVQTIRARAIEITTRVPRPIDIDGELGARTPARFEVLPRALRVFAPEPAEGEA